MGASDVTVYAHWKANSVSLMDGNWGCSNNCLSGQSTCSVSTSTLTVQTWGNYNASWWVNFTKHDRNRNTINKLIFYNGGNYCEAKRIYPENK